MKLYYIGNGFDLAHGLKTSYLDFFADVIKSVLLFKKVERH